MSGGGWGDHAPDANLCANKNSLLFPLTAPFAHSSAMEYIESVFDCGGVIHSTSG